MQLFKFAVTRSAENALEDAFVESLNDPEHSNDLINVCENSYDD